MKFSLCNWESIFGQSLHHFVCGINPNSPKGCCSLTHVLQTCCRNFGSKPPRTGTTQLQNCTKITDFRLSVLNRLSHQPPDSQTLSSCYSTFYVGSCPSSFNKGQAAIVNLVVRYVVSPPCTIGYLGGATSRALGQTARGCEGHRRLHDTARHIRLHRDCFCCPMRLVVIP